jgi:hypothetical protein
MARTPQRHVGEYNRKGYDFGFDQESNRAMREEIQNLMDNEGMSYEQAAFAAAATLDGAGELATVNSIQTCTDIGGNPIPGLSGPDAAVCRLDENVATEVKRRRAAEKGQDEAALWLEEHDPEAYRQFYGPRD